MLEINLTLIYQAVAYFILLYLLNRFLYKPVLGVLDERKKRIEEPIKDAEALDIEVESGFADYEKGLKEATASAQEDRSAVRQEATETERALLDEARKKANAELASLREELQKSKADAIAELKGEAPALTKGIAEKLMGRAVSMVALCILSAMVILPTVAFASEGSVDPWKDPWRVGNFVVLAAGLYFIWRKWLKGALDNRVEEIKNSIEVAEKTKAEAEAKLAEYKEKTSGLEKKVEDIRTKLRAEAEAEKKKIISEAELQAKRLSEQVKLTAAQELKKARVAIKREIAELAVEAATELIGREMKPEDQERITREYIDKLRVN